MRRLFIPLLFSAFLLGCDGTEPDRIVGTWVLEGVTDAERGEIDGPTGSRLTFEGDGRFRLDSGNDCSGTHTSEFVVNQSILDLDFESCTEIATTFETDLSIVLGAFEDDVVLDGPTFFRDDPSRMDILVFSPEASLSLRFSAL